VSPEVDNQSNSPNAEVLGSWKEIAAFFDVTVRTVQIWEEERGLPVRRNPGGKGRVFAYVAELQAWRDGAQVESRSNPPEAVQPPLSRAHWILWSAPIAVLTALALLGLLKTGPRTPSAYRVAGQSLIVSDQEGRILWTHRFESAISPTWETESTFSGPVFEDIDGDGAVELLFPFNSNIPWGAHNGALYCFSSSGSVRWVFRPERNVSTHKSRFAPPYELRLLALVPGEVGSPMRIFAAATHTADNPSQAVLLDTNGKVVREYWHSGHYGAVLVTDLVPGGGPEIYLGAVSNAARRASLIVLDPRDFEGAASEEDSDYQILGFPPPRELGRILFSRMKASHSVTFDHIAALARSGDRLIVGVSDTSGLAAYQAYFGPQMNFIDISISTTTYGTYRKLHAQGLVPIDNPDPELPELRKVRYLTPSQAASR